MTRAKDEQNPLSASGDVNNGSDFLLDDDELDDVAGAAESNESRLASLIGKKPPKPTQPRF